MYWPLKLDTRVRVKVQALGVTHILPEFRRYNSQAEVFGVMASSPSFIPHRSEGDHNGSVAKGWLDGGSPAMKCEQIINKTIDELNFKVSKGLNGQEIEDNSWSPE